MLTVVYDHVCITGQTADKDRGRERQKENKKKKKIQKKWERDEVGLHRPRCSRYKPTDLLMCSILSRIIISYVTNVVSLHNTDLLCLNELSVDIKDVKTHSFRIAINKLFKLMMQVCDIVYNMSRMVRIKRCK